MISGQFAKSVFRGAIGASLFMLVAVASQPVHAQFGVFGNRAFGVVGGVSVDAKGTLRSASTAERSGVLRKMRSEVGQPAGGMQAQLRMISLRGLQEEIATAVAENRILSDEVLYLAGLQRVEYVFVYPEKNDIVLAGPAEGWVVREDASVVGETTGRPVIHLEDLIVALRSTEQTRQQPMTVSIDPTPEGEVKLRQLLARVNGSRVNPAQLEPMMKQAFGQQVVSLNAVPRSSRMASTLVAADYKMKRLAMELEKSPVEGLSSYMQMVRNGGASLGTQPRWWMASNYDAILHSQDRLAWQLTGQGIKAMTEDEVVAENGLRQQTGRANKNAQRWADTFTAKFDALCEHTAAFGDLRNVMDLNIVATVIAGHGLESVAGCDLALLRGVEGDLQTPTYQVPQNVDPECSFVRSSTGWAVSASGGVELNPWKVVSSTSKVAPETSAVRQTAQPVGNRWWW